MEEFCWKEFIKSGAVLLWIVAFVVVSISVFIFSILLQKKSDKGDRWFLASCLLSFPCSIFAALLCGLAFFEEKWSLLGKRFIIYLFFLILALACFVIGRYKSKRGVEDLPVEKREATQEKSKEKPEENKKKLEEEKQVEKVEKPTVEKLEIGSEESLKSEGSLKQEEKKEEKEPEEKDIEEKKEEGFWD